MSRVEEAVAGWRKWIGRTITEQDQLDVFPARGMAALLDRDPNSITKGSLLPPGWHWLYFKPVTRQSELGDDGHALRGGFLPPVSLPRRMWAGGSLNFEAPLRFGEDVERISTVRDVTAKQGRTGPLVFVTVHHVVSGSGGVACDEQQHIVYRDARPPGSAQPDAGQKLLEPVAWREEFLPTYTALFRFSALTFNGHRIHYDAPYAVREGYPDIVVHAPLIAMVLLDAAVRHGPGRDPSHFEYRALSPRFAGAPVLLQGSTFTGDQIRLWATDGDGNIAMTANADW